MKCIFKDHRFSIEGTSIGGVEGKDYRIRYRQGSFPVLIMAPHGGLIEPGTSELADIIAGKDFWFYAFEGIRFRDNYSRLHISSTVFNEPRWQNITGRVYSTITVHGVRGSEQDPIIIGGRNFELAEKLSTFLLCYGFAARIISAGPIGGMSYENVVNKNLSNSGVQLEIPRGLRNILLRDIERMSELGTLIRRAAFIWLNSKGFEKSRC